MKTYRAYGLNNKVIQRGVCTNVFPKIKNPPQGITLRIQKEAIVEGELKVVGFQWYVWDRAVWMKLPLMKEYEQAR